MLLGLRKVVVASLASAVWLGTLPLAAFEQGAPSRMERRQRPFLGLRVEVVRPGVIKNLPEQFHAGQGLIVVAIVPGSPAEKAGIKPRDVLMSYDDQKLFSGRQLAGLVGTDKSGRTVDLTILRGNNPQQIKAILGDQSPRPVKPTTGTMPGAAPQPTPAAGAQSSGKEGPEETFDSMILQSAGKDRFKVQIQYLDKNGKLQKHAFEGTLKELRHSIVSEKDLPTSERAQLLGSLNLSSQGGEFPELSRRAPTDSK